MTSTSSSLLRVFVLVALLASACATGGDPALRAPTEATCTDESGELTELSIDVPTEAPPGSETALVYTPACLNLDDAHLLIMFHGAGQQPTAWTDDPVGIHTVSDELLANDDINQTVIVAVGGAQNPGFADTAVSPLLAAIDAELGGVPRLITTLGFSLGGPTALRAAIHPELQADSLVLVGSVWTDDLPELINEADADGRLSITRVFLDAGVDDSFGDSIPDQQAAFESHVASLKIDRAPGGHSVEYLASRTTEWLLWVAG